MFCWVFGFVSFCGGGFVCFVFWFFSEIKEKSPLNYLIKFPIANSVPILADQKKRFCHPFLFLTLCRAD